MKKYLLTAAAFLSTAGAFAHEGHGHTHGYTIKHYFTEPPHAFVLLAAVVTIVTVVNFIHKKAAVNK